MDIVFFGGITLDTFGTVLIAYTALRVHDRVRKERSIDQAVTKEMSRERALGITGVVFILAGYALQIFERAL